MHFDTRLYSFAKAVLTKEHKLGALNNTSILPQSIG